MLAFGTLHDRVFRFFTNKVKPDATAPKGRCNPDDKATDAVCADGKHAGEVRSVNLEVRFDAPAGTLSLSNAQQDAGWFGLRFYLLSRGRMRIAQTDGKVQRRGQTQVWRGAIGKNIRVTLAVSPSPTGKGWVVVPELENRGKNACAFTGYGFCVADGAPGVRVPGGTKGLLVHAHSENLRHESLPHCRAEFPFIRPLPRTPTRLGAQASGPIPALFCGQTNGTHWLMEGQFTQNRHLLSWYLGIPSTPERTADYRSEYTWTGGAPEQVAPHQRRRLEASLFRLIQAAPDGLYAPYIDEISRAHHFAGRDSRLVHEPVYCTWNFGIQTEINEADCLRRMDVVANVQKGGYFQIDHGYQKPAHPGGKASIEVDAYYPDPEAAWDLERFPSGPRGFVHACRARGLRPAIWWSPRVDRAGKLRREHPEWMLRDRKGRLIDLEHLLLDPSVPEARAFMERCIRTTIREWGFEGFKMDFFSYMFDHDQALFRHGGTGTAWKKWLFGFIRATLGPRGYFLHCISCPLGNPFMALAGADAFRAGVDIHAGAWGYHVRGSSWLLPAVMASGKKTWFADIDGFMGSPDIPATERRTRCAFGYMTAGMLDFSGPVERLDRQALLDYRRLVERCDQGGGTQCPDPEAFYGRPLPRILLRHHAAGSRTRRRFKLAATLAFFNWSDTEQSVACPLATLGLPSNVVHLTDFWTGRPVARQGAHLTATLPPRGHIIWDISHHA